MSDLHSTHAKCEWKNSHTSMQFFQSLWSNRWMFGVGRSFTWLCVCLCSENLHSFTTGIEMTSRMTHFYLSGKGNDEATVVRLSCSCFGNRLRNHFQSTTVIQADKAGPSLINLQICLRLVLIDLEQSFNSPEMQNKINLPSLTPACQSNFQWFYAFISLDNFLTLSAS